MSHCFPHSSAKIFHTPCTTQFLRDSMFSGRMVESGYVVLNQIIAQDSHCLLYRKKYEADSFIYNATCAMLYRIINLLYGKINKQKNGVF